MGAVQAESARLAYWDIDLNRDGPGLLLRDITRGKDDQIAAALEVIEAVGPDVLVLSGFDTDAAGATLAAFVDAIPEVGYAHRFTQLGNEGRASGYDLNGDGLTNTANDALGYGEFTGQGGLAILSRGAFPLSLAQDFTDVLWADLPANTIEDGTLPDGIEAVHRLSTTSHWVLNAGPLQLLVHSGTAPIFDGPEDRNGRRGHDEAALWLQVLEGRLGEPVEGPFVLMAKVNIDPKDGEGRPGAIRALLAHPRLQDPAPKSEGAALEATPGHS
ncbi:MAG: endonuclease/exonuclease/phosphatase family protein [Marinovum sp.]|nr:endonuclease/exonuclease/phosphatase family protein [Marinovum sp.]